MRIFKLIVAIIFFAFLSVIIAFGSVFGAVGSFPLGRFIAVGLGSFVFFVAAYLFQDFRKKSTDDINKK